MDNHSPIGAASILFVEDEADLRELIAEELREAGYQVTEAAHGQEALRVLEHCQPDLIVCDIVMPIMGGYALLQHLREQREDLAHVPFIFLSAQDEAAQIISGKHAGADDYLVKPVNFDLMLATVAAHLRQVHRLRTQLQAHHQAVLGESLASSGDSSRFLQRFAKTLDMISSGIVVLDGAAQTLFMNSAAKNMIDKEACPEVMAMLETQGDRLSWRHSIIREALAAKHDDDYIGFLSLTCTGGQRDLLLTICPIGCETNALNAPTVVLFFSSGGRHDAVPLKALATFFQLTPMESQVAWSFAQGMRSEDIAQAFNISMTTVAFHKRNIFQKTHTHRQADLVALLLTLPAVAE